MNLRKIRYRATMVGLLSAVFLGGLVAASTISRTSLRPVPFRNARELVQFIRVNKGEPNAWSADSLRATAALTPEVRALAWFTFPAPTRVRIGAREVTGTATIVSSDFFSVLGVSRGMTLPYGSDLAVVTRRFARTLGVAEPVGESIVIGDRALRIAAVLPDDEAYPITANIWYAELGEGGSQWAGLARVREGVTLEEAGNRLSLAYKTVDRDLRSRVSVSSVIDGARPAMASDQRSLIAAIVLFGAIGVLNFALLGIGEARRRIREYAIRIAVGASPTQIAREVALEQVRIVGIALGIAVVLLVAGTRAALPTLPRVHRHCPRTRLRPRGARGALAHRHHARRDGFNDPSPGARAGQPL